MSGRRIIQPMLAGSSCLLAIGMLLSSVLTVAAGVEEAVRVELRTKVQCKTPVYRLGDLLVSEVEAELADRVMGKSPLPGHSLRLSKRRLIRSLADWGRRWDISGPEWITLQSPGVELNSAALKPRVHANLDSLLAARGLVRDEEVAGWPESIILSSSRIRWDISLQSEKDTRSLIARLNIEDAGGFSASYPLRLRCHKPGMVLVARQPFERGESLSDWELVERDLLAVANVPLSEQEIVGAVAKSQIAIGDVLTRGNVKAAVLVHAGREVEVRLERGAVKISLKGVAQGDGALGDVVGVRHLGSRELRRYRVTGKDAVAPSYLSVSGEGS